MSAMCRFPPPHTQSDGGSCSPSLDPKALASCNGSMQKLIDNPHYTSLGPRIALLEKVRAGMKVVNKDGPFFQANVIKELSTTIGHGSKTVTNTYVAFKIAKQFVLIENASARKNEIAALEKAMTTKGVAELVNASLRAALTALKDAAWTP